MKLVKPALNSSAGLPSRPKSASAPTASGRVHDSRSRPPMRAAASPATQARATRHRANETALHCTYGHSSAVRSSSGDTGCAASSAIDQTVECSEGYHWFQAIEPSIVGQVVLADS